MAALCLMPKCGTRSACFNVGVIAFAQIAGFKALFGGEIIVGGQRVL